MNKIKIGYKTCDIIYDDSKLKDEGLLGQIQYDKNLIRLRDNEEKYNKLSTFIHEVIHGIFFHSGNDKFKQNESLVDCLANGLTQVIVDNNIEIIFQKSKPEIIPKIDKHEDWIGKKVNCWDDNKPNNPNIMEYIGFNEETSLPYECTKEGVEYLWKNVELVDDKND